MQDLSETDRRRWRMLLHQLWRTSPDRLSLQDALDRLWASAVFLDELRELFALLFEPTVHLAPPLVWDQPVPLALHARYSRAEIYAAFGLITDAQQTTCPSCGGAFPVAFISFSMPMPRPWTTPSAT